MEPSWPGIIERLEDKERIVPLPRGGDGLASLHASVEKKGYSEETMRDEPARSVVLVEPLNKS